MKAFLKLGIVISCLLLPDSAYNSNEWNNQGWPSGWGSELIIRPRQVQLLHPGLEARPFDNHYNRVTEVAEVAAFLGKIHFLQRG